MSTFPQFPCPVPLLTADERAGFRLACQMIRQEGARMMRHAHRLPDAPGAAVPAEALEQHQKNHILQLCAIGVSLCVDHVERHLPKPLH